MTDNADAWLSGYVASLVLIGVLYGLTQMSSCIALDNCMRFVQNKDVPESLKIVAFQPGGVCSTEKEKK